MRNIINTGSIGDDLFVKRKGGHVPGHMWGPARRDLVGPISIQVLSNLMMTIHSQAWAQLQKYERDIEYIN